MCENHNLTGTYIQLVTTFGTCGGLFDSEAEVREHAISRGIRITHTRTVTLPFTNKR